MSALADRAIRYGSLIKVEHTLFSFPMLLAGALLGCGMWPRPGTLALVIVTGFFARALAMLLNRIIDRELDRRNPRTAARELPAGRVGLGEARLLSAAALAGYLFCAAMLGSLCLALSPIPVIVFVGYPYLKRFTPLAHFGVGLGLAMAPLGGFIGASLQLPATPGILSLALFVFFWVSGFDIIYSTLDEEFDRSSGVFSMPAVLGRKRALTISGALHVLAFLSLLALGLLMGLRPLALVLLGLTAFFLFLEHRLSHDVDMAFFKGNVVVGFLVLGLAHALTYRI